MKICIFGDSWACGEWDWDNQKKYSIAHKGLEFFLSESHEVINLGHGGLSNKEAILRLKDRLQVSEFDYIFWFKTDPLRDLRPYICLKDANLTYDHLLKLKKQQTLESYNSLNKLGVKVHCIGGAEKLDLPKLNNYPNLVPFIPCLTELLNPNFKHPEIWSSDWLHLLNKQLNLECLDKLLVEKRKQDKLREFKEEFWPDGNHPNRESHKKLYDIICKELNL